MITTNHRVHFQTGRESRKVLRKGKKKPRPVGQVPRIAKLMALAIRLEGLIQDGTVTDQAELARLGHVSRARLTQIMNLLCLAPDIQEEILFLSPTASGGHEISERDLRPIMAVASWERQRELW